jgi:hypothetical protein
MREVEVQGLKGKFHQWGLEPFERTNITIGIIELEDGRIITERPHYIKFTQTQTQ